MEDMADRVGTTLQVQRPPFNDTCRGVDFSFHFGEYSECESHRGANNDIASGPDWVVIEALTGANDKAASTVGQNFGLAGNYLKLNPAPSKFPRYKRNARCLLTSLEHMAQVSFPSTNALPLVTASYGANTSYESSQPTNG